MDAALEAVVADGEPLDVESLPGGEHVEECGVRAFRRRHLSDIELVHESAAELGENRAAAGASLLRW
jgi:hypothetical protein